MKRRLKDFMVKLFALAIAIVMSIPASAFAQVLEKTDKSYTEDSSVMGLQDPVNGSNTDPITSTGPVLIKSDIATEETTDYIIEKSASLSKATGLINFRIAVKAKAPSKDTESKLSAIFAINENTDLKDIELTKLTSLDASNKEEEIEANKATPGILENNDSLDTLALTTEKPAYGMVYYLSAKVDDQAMADLDEQSPALSLDIALKEKEDSIYNNRYSLKYNNQEESQEEGRTVELNRIESLEEVEADHLIKGQYKEESTGLFAKEAAQITWTDYILSKDDAEFAYKFDLDQAQSTENSQILLEFFEAKEKGYIQNKSFTQKLPFAQSINLQVPAGQIAKISLTSLVADDKAKEFTFNDKTIANPAYKEDTEEKEESSQDDEEAPSQASPVLMEDAESEDSLLEISDIEQKTQQAANQSKYKTSYPYSIEYDVTTSVRDGNGKPISAAIPSAGQNPEVWWDITLDTSKFKDPNLNFDNLYYTLYMGAKDGLDRFKYKASTSSIAEDETRGFDTADTRSEFLYQGFDNIAKKNLGDKLYIRVKAPLNSDREVHEQYSLGIRINPDKNYINNLLKEFLAKYKSIPTPLKWKLGDGQADIYKDRPFNLLDERIVASPNFIKYDIDDNFYFDSTRSITADRISDTRVEWNVLDLLRFGESEDPSIEKASLNPEVKNRNKYYYRPNLTGGYNRYSDKSDVKTKKGEFYPGTIVAYNFDRQDARSNTKYKLDVELKDKENLFKVLLDNQMIGNNNLTNKVGGSVKAYTYKIPQGDIDDQYLAYNENPFAIMRINKTFEMVQCFNDGYEDPTSSGNDIIGLQRIEDPEARFLYDMLAGNNADYAKENFKPGAKYNKQKTSDEEALSDQEALKDALERAYYYTNQVVEEKEKETKHKIPRQVEAFLYQKMVHLITNNKDLDEQYGVDTSIPDSNKNWTDIDITLTGNKPDKNYTGEKSKANRTIPKNERRLGSDNQSLTESLNLAQEAERRLNASYTNGDWNDAKANSVDLIFYKHNHNKTIQNLITAKIRKPINAQKINVDGTNLEGAEFTFTSRQTGESVKWTSQKDNTNNPLFLKPGQYYVDETKAPKGYSELDTFLIELKEGEVNSDHGPYPQHGLGDIKVNDGYKYELSILNPDTVQKDGSGNPLVTVDKDKLNLNIKNEDSKLGKIDFTKVNKSGRELDGATFTLTKITNEKDLKSIDKKGEKPVYQKTSTGNNGKFTFGSIPAGTYKLEETKAPAGYQSIDPLILIATEDQDGKVTVEFKDEGIQESKEIINKAPSTELSFRKIKEKEDGEEVVPIDSGTGKFRLYSTSTTDDSDYDRTVSPSSVVVEEDQEKGTPGLQVGEFKFTDLVAGEYILVEEQAPIGFEKPDFPFWSVKVTENEGKLSYEVYKLEKESGKETKIDETDILDEENKTIGKTFEIENKARTINHKFKKYLDKEGNKEVMDANLRGEDGERVSFRLYEADYYGLKKDPNDIGKRIVADEKGDFNLEGLEYSTYYLLEEENPPKGYAKAAATVLYVQSEAEVQSGKMALVVRDHTNNTVTGEHNVFDGIVDYRAGEAFGNLLVKKTGKSLIEGDDSEVGLRRAYFRLYYADKDFNYANEKFQQVKNIDKASYIQRVTAGIALTDDKGNPIDTKLLPNDQGIAKFENLKPGNYILVEHRGPAGYEKDPAPRYIKVTESGRVIKSLIKNDNSFKEEEIKNPNLFDTGNLNFFSTNRSTADKADTLMISDLPENINSQKASQASQGTWEDVVYFRSETPYRNQDPAGN